MLLNETKVPLSWVKSEYLGVSLQPVPIGKCPILDYLGLGWSFLEGH